MQILLKLIDLESSISQKTNRSKQKQRKNLTLLTDTDHTVGTDLENIFPNDALIQIYC